MFYRAPLDDCFCYTRVSDRALLKKKAVHIKRQTRLNNLKVVQNNFIYIFWEVNLTRVWVKYTPGLKFKNSFLVFQIYL